MQRSKAPVSQPRLAHYLTTSLALPLQHLQDGLSKGMRGVRVLAKQQLGARDDDMGRPGDGVLLVPAAAVVVELLLEVERDAGGGDLVGDGLLLLGVAEAGHAVALDQVRAVRELDVDQRRGAVAQRHDDLVRVVELAEQLDRRLVRRQVVHRPEAAHDEDQVELVGAAQVQREQRRRLPHGLLRVEELLAVRVVFEEFHRDRVHDARALRGPDARLNVFVQDLPGVCELRLHGDGGLVSWISKVVF